MFFDRSGSKSQRLSTDPAKKLAPSQQSAAQQSATPASSRRNWAALALAAAIAAPFGVVQLARLQAQDAKPDPGSKPQPAAPNSAELLRTAREQFARGQYDQAAKSLSGVKKSDVPAGEQAGYMNFALEVLGASANRGIAKDELGAGEDALKSGRTSDALAHFRAVTDNKYADNAVIHTAQLRLAMLDGNASQKTADSAPALADGAIAQAAPQAPVVQAVAQQTPSGDLTPKQRYELGLKQYRTNNWGEARVNLQIAQTAGYKPESIFQDAPEVLIKRMDARNDVIRQPVQRLVQAANQPAANQNDPLTALKATDEGERVRHDQAVSQSQQWVTQAQDAERQQNFDRALDLYTRASDLDPNNSTAIQGRDHLASVMGRAPAPAVGGDDASRSVLARKGEIRYQINSNLDEARTAIQAGRWSDAQASIDRARLGVSLDPTIFSAEEIRQFRNRVDQANLDLQQAREAAEAASAHDTQTHIDVQIQNAKKLQQIQTQRTVADLIRTAQSLTNQGKYREALQTVQQILVLDPHNDYAVGVHALLEDKVQFQLDRQYLERKDHESSAQFIRGDEAMIPYNDIMVYPSDWPDISAQRDLYVQGENGGGDTDKKVIATLNKIVPSVNFEAVSFNDVVEFLRDISGANIFVNWKVLEAAGIDRNTPVTANVHNIKLSKALDIILESVGGGTTKLGYTVDEGVFQISTQDDLGKNTVTRVYDIRDLLISSPDFTDAPALTLDQTQNQGGGGGGTALGQGGGGGSISTTNSLFSGGNANGNNNKQIGPSKADLIDQIQKLITETVAADTWKDNGGSIGSLRVFEPGGQLIVTQTPENHRQLDALLNRIREERAVLVTVETRFLTVQRNFLEDTGLDLLFQFNLNSSWSKKFGVIGAQTPVSTYVQNPQTSVPGSLGSALQTPQGLQSSATYLDDFQVQMTMRAVQASVNSTVVTAPRVTLFNGQRSYVLVSVTRAYVSNLTPVVSTGVSSFAPTPGNVQSGVLLDVQATVSADRKYVTMTLRPWLSNLLDLEPFTFQGGTTAQATGNGTVVNNTPTGTIQLPETSQTQIRTTVSVPDGGTLLLGGQTVAAETTREVGVPILSKIPYLKRLFTNRSYAKDEQVLLILVRPTIVLQREIEQKQFPLLTNRLTGPAQ